jgi:putative membrane protein
MEIAHAHGILSETPSPFEMKWSWDPAFLFFVLLVILYLRGLKNYNGKAPVQLWQKIFFFLGITFLFLAYLPPIDSWADKLFSAHMTQHLIITSVAVPLILFGNPFFLAVRGMPVSLRNHVLIPLLQWRLLRGFFNYLQRPLVAVLLFEVTMWFWHIPIFYNKALLNDFFHLIEHACMAFAAVNMWRLFIDPSLLRSPLNKPVRFLFLVLMMTLDMFLSAALTYSQRVWYAYDRLPIPDWWAWDRLQDQRLGGLIMWVPGGLIWLTALVATFVVWAQEEVNMRGTCETNPFGKIH